MKANRDRFSGSGRTSCVRGGLVAAMALFANALPAAPAVAGDAACDRACMADTVNQVLRSMVARDPASLPLAQAYRATENSHPSAVKFMTLWRTVTRADKPDLLAIDTVGGQAYFGMDIGESGSTSVLWGRLKVVDRKISEMELYVDRSVGDHGSAFSPDELSGHYQRWMVLPQARKKASREELLQLARAAFDSRLLPKLEVSENCQNVEMGEHVGYGCLWRSDRPSDPNARIAVIDEDLGVVVVFAIVPGSVQPWQWPWEDVPGSAFVPTSMSQGGANMGPRGGKAAIARMPTTGEVAQLLQFYDGKLQGSQINVYLSGPGMESAWVGR